MTQSRCQLILVKSMAFVVTPTGIQTRVLPLHSCVTLGKLLNLPVPWFPRSFRGKIIIRIMHGRIRKVDPCEEYSTVPGT